MSKAVLAVACASSLAGSAGCLIEGSNAENCSREPTPVNPDGALTGWVVDRLDLPSNYDETQRLGLDIDYWFDDDIDPAVDNQLGTVTSIFAGTLGYDVDAEANAMIASGALLHLLELQTTSTTNARGAGMRVGLGLDLDTDATDNFSGSEPLEFDPAHGSGLVTGDIVDGQFHFFMGETRIGVAFPGMDEPFILPLIETQVAGTITPTEITGRLGGGVPAEFIDQTMLPVILEGLDRVIARDCPDGTCVPDSSGDLVLHFLDANADGTLTLAELRDAPLVQNLLTPDLDTRNDVTGEPLGNCAGVNDPDALSLGLGFHAVRAQIQ